MFHSKGPTFFELARQGLSSTTRGYDLLAPKFDFTPFRTPSFVLDIVQREIAKHGSFQDGIDICCGTGAGIELLLKCCSRRVVGVDLSQGMLDQGKSQVNPLNENQSIQWVLGDALDLPFENEFDIAVTFGAIGHFRPQQQKMFLKNAFQSLKPGGKLFFVTHLMPSIFSLHYWFARSFNGAMHVRNFLIRPPFIMFYLTFLAEETTQMMTEVGFEVSETSPFESIDKRLKLLRLLTATKP